MCVLMWVPVCLFFVCNICWYVSVFVRDVKTDYVNWSNFLIGSCWKIVISECFMKLSV